jgi:hypothetical protein
VTGPEPDGSWTAAGRRLDSIVLHLYANGLHPELLAAARSARVEGPGWRARAALLAGGGHLVELARSSRAPSSHGGREVRTLVVEPAPDTASGGPLAGRGDLPLAGCLDRRLLASEPRGQLEDEAGALVLRVAWSLERLQPAELTRAHARLLAAPAPGGGHRLVHDGGHRENDAPGRWTRLDLTGQGTTVDVLATLVDPGTSTLLVVHLEASCRG